jgi:hypothetical protein
VFCRTENMTQKDMTHERPIDKQSTKAQTDTNIYECTELRHVVDKAICMYLN